MTTLLQLGVVVPNVGLISDEQSSRNALTPNTSGSLFGAKTIHVYLKFPLL